MALYQRATSDSREPVWRRTLLAGTGALMTVGGAILTVAPIPFGFAVLVPGTILLASRSRRSARLLDTLEQRLSGFSLRRNKAQKPVQKTARKTGQK